MDKTAEMEELDDNYGPDAQIEDGVEQELWDEKTHLMEKPFDPAKINIDTKTPSLDTLIKRIERKTIAMNTDEYFQRKDDLWDVVKQSRLIESILIRFPLPAFFFDATNDNHWLIVDGLQRLSSIRNFCVLKTLRLTNLEFLTQLEGRSWNELDEDLQRVIEETQIVIHKILPGTPTDVKFNIFKRINTGGLVLEPQEIRHALFQGTPAKFVAELANSTSFKKVTRNKVPTHRMLDRDFVNRFLCFYLFGYKNYEPDLDTFMSKAMAALYNLTQEQLNTIKQAFERSMQVSLKIFGKEAFRKVWDDNRKLPPLNKAMFDVLATQIAKLSEEECAILIDKRELFKKLLKDKLKNDVSLMASVTSSTGDKYKVIYRHETIKRLIEQTIKEL